MTGERWKVLAAGLLLASLGVAGLGLFLVGDANQERCLDGRCDPGDTYAWAGILGVGTLILGLLFLMVGAFRRWGW